MKSLFISLSLLLVFNMSYSQSECKSFQKMYKDAITDFTKYKGKVHTSGSGIAMQGSTWYDYDINLWKADKIELLKGPWDICYTLRYKYLRMVGPEQARTFLNKILESIKSCYPKGCTVYKTDDFNPEEPFYIIGAKGDVNPVENESEAKFPIIRLSLDYNNVELSISAPAQE